jgi:hypothetical protein
MGSDAILFYFCSNPVVIFFTRATAGSTGYRQGRNHRLIVKMVEIRMKDAIEYILTGNRGTRELKPVDSNICLYVTTKNLQINSTRFY